MSGKCPGNFRKISRTFLGNFPEIGYIGARAVANIAHGVARGLCGCCTGVLLVSLTRAVRRQISELDAYTLFLY